MAKKEQLSHQGATRDMDTRIDTRIYDVLVEIRNILEDMRELQADVARDVKKLEQARKF